MGYEVWAIIFFKALTGQTSFPLDIFQCLSRQQKNTSVTITERDGIKSLQDIFLYYKKLQIAKLDGIAPGNPLIKEAKSFIAFFNSSESFIRGIYQATPFQLNEKNKVFIKRDGKKFLLGSVFSIDEKKIFFGFQKDYILGNIRSVIEPHKFSLLFSDKIFPENINSMPSHSKTMKLYIDNYKIADLEIEKKWKKPHAYRIVWHKGEGFSFSGTLTHSIRHRDLPKKMNLSFMYINETKESITSPVLGFPCIKNKKELHIDIPNLDFL